MSTTFRQVIPLYLIIICISPFFIHKNVQQLRNAFLIHFSYVNINSDLFRDYFYFHTKVIHF